jgi:hypothetical protein
MSASSSSERHPGRPECNDSPIGELIEGLNAIAALPIPYARLPKRAQVGWAPVLRTWGDVAAETPGSLLARPKAGQALLQALLGAAEEAVATARTPAPADAASSAARLLVRLSEHDRIVLAARTWALHPAGTDEVAARLGAGRNAVLRHQPRAQQRFVELLDDPAHADLKTHGAALAARLGAVTTEQAVKAALAAAGVALGRTYPRPVVGLAEGRARALAAYAALRRPALARARRCRMAGCGSWATCMAMPAPSPTPRRPTATCSSWATWSITGRTARARSGSCSG